MFEQDSINSILTCPALFSLFIFVDIFLISWDLLNLSGCLGSKVNKATTINRSFWLPTPHSLIPVHLLTDVNPIDAFFVLWKLFLTSLS